MKPIVIYHGNCQDGFAAAWCFWKVFGNAFEYFHGKYSESPPNVENRDVYLVDFSYKRSVIEQMIAKANNVTLIDHHKSALEDLDGLKGLHGLDSPYCSLEHSGCMLAWKVVQGTKPPPQLLLHIEDRDLWRFVLEGTRQITAALFSFPYDFDCYTNLIENTDIKELFKDGVAIERKHHKDIAELVKFSKRSMVINGVEVPVANLPYMFSSDAGHLMALDAPFAACYIDTPTNRVFSLRSTENGIDVAKIAEMYGGGGHKHASGFSVPRDHILARS